MKKQMLSNTLFRPSGIRSTFNYKSACNKKIASDPKTRWASNKQNTRKPSKEKQRKQIGIGCGISESKKKDTYQTGGLPSCPLAYTHKLRASRLHQHSIQLSSQDSHAVA